MPSPSTPPPTRARTNTTTSQINHSDSPSTTSHQAPIYSRSPVAAQQATTVTGGNAVSQQLVMWSKRLDAALRSSWPVGLLQVRETLGAIFQDGSLPISVRSDAVMENAELGDDGEISSVVRFLQKMQALAGAVGGPVTAGPQRNFQLPPAQLQPTQATTIGGMPTVPLPPVDPYFGTPAAKRIPLNQVGPNVRYTIEQIVGNMELSPKQQIAKIAEDSHVTSRRASDWYKSAVREISFGLSREDAERVLEYVKTARLHLTTEKSIQCGVAYHFADTPHNPEAVRMLFGAVNAEVGLNGDAAAVTWDSLAKHVPPEHLHHFNAMKDKGREMLAGDGDAAVQYKRYATAGRVSPPLRELYPAAQNLPVGMEIAQPAVVATLPAATLAAVPAPVITFPAEAPVPNCGDNVETVAKRQRLEEQVSSFPVMPFELLQTVLPAATAAQQAASEPIAMETLPMPPSPLLAEKAQQS